MVLPKMHVFPANNDRNPSVWRRFTRGVTGKPPRQGPSINNMQQAGRYTAHGVNTQAQYDESSGSAE